MHVRWVYSAYLRQECHDSNSVISQEKILKGLKCYNFIETKPTRWTLPNGIYYYKCSTCFRPFLRPSSELKTIYTASGICRAFLLLTAIVSELEQIPDAEYTVLSSWWWTEEPPETCRAFIVINIIVYRCILLVMLTNKENRTVMCQQSVVVSLEIQYHWADSCRLKYAH